MIKTGKIISETKSRYEIYAENQVYNAAAKGNLRIKDQKITVGDNVEFAYEENSLNVITRIFPRKNILIRPPVANIDTLFVCLSPILPEPNLLNIDKLLAVAVDNDISPVVVITKTDLDPMKAKKLAEVYQTVGFKTVLATNTAPEETKKKILDSFDGEVCAFAGASGVGKSTIVDFFLPKREIKIGNISEKTSHGKHTTKECTLYLISDECEHPKFLADTPGFSLIDFEKFFFIEKDNLKFAFPEFRQYLGKCRYTKCSHTIEDGCAIIEAKNDGKIIGSRHESYVSLMNEMRNQDHYSKKKQNFNKSK